MDSQKPGFEGRIMSLESGEVCLESRNTDGNSCWGISEYLHKIKNQPLGTCGVSDLHLPFLPF